MTCFGCQATQSGSECSVGPPETGFQEFCLWKVWGRISSLVYSQHAPSLPRPNARQHAVIQLNGHLTKWPPQHFCISPFYFLHDAFLMPSFCQKNSPFSALTITLHPALWLRQSSLIPGGLSFLYVLLRLSQKPPSKGFNRPVWNSAKCLNLLPITDSFHAYVKISRKLATCILKLGRAFSITTFHTHRQWCSNCKRFVSVPLLHLIFLSSIPTLHTFNLSLNWQIDMDILGKKTMPVEAFIMDGRGHNESKNRQTKSLARIMKRGGTQRWCKQTSEKNSKCWHVGMVILRDKVALIRSILKQAQPCQDLSGVKKRWSHHQCYWWLKLSGFPCAYITLNILIGREDRV